MVRVRLNRRTGVRKNVPLTGRNLEQNQTQCPQSFAAVAWERKEKRRDREDRELSEQEQQDPGTAMERPLDPAAVRGLRGSGVEGGTSNMRCKSYKKMEHESFREEGELALNKAR